MVPVGLSFFLLAAGGDLPLVDAARNADAGAVRALIQKGANVNATEGDGTTALHWAAHRDDLATVDLLIRSGARVNAANDLGATPLWAACLNGNPAIVRRLLQAGANPNAALLLGETPLMVAARSGNADVVEQLTAKGATVNTRAARGQTALMWAVSQRHPDVVKVLLAHGADVQARSDTWSQVMAVPPHGMPSPQRNVLLQNSKTFDLSDLIAFLTLISMIKIPQNMQFHCFYSVELEKQLISHSNLLHSISLTITYPFE